MMTPWRIEHVEEMGSMNLLARSGFAAIYPRIAAIDYLAGRQVVVRQLDGSLLVGGQSVWAGEAHVEQY